MRSKRRREQSLQTRNFTHHPGYQEVGIAHLPMHNATVDAWQSELDVQGFEAGLAYIDGVCVSPHILTDPL